MDIEELILTYGDYLYRVAFIYTKSHPVAEEVVQDVFLLIIKNLINLKGMPH